MVIDSVVADHPLVESAPPNRVFLRVTLPKRTENGRFGPNIITFLLSRSFGARQHYVTRAVNGSRRANFRILPLSARLEQNKLLSGGGAVDPPSREQTPYKYLSNTADVRREKPRDRAQTSWFARETMPSAPGRLFFRSKPKKRTETVKMTTRALGPVLLASSTSKIEYGSGDSFLRKKMRPNRDSGRALKREKNRHKIHAVLRV